MSLTEPQVRARTKDVTRRVGWLNLTPGTRLTLCRKVMGRRAGDPLVRIVNVEVVSVRRERLDTITPEDVAREGFPDWTPERFVAMFCETHRGCTPASQVTRIEWRYLEPETPLLGYVEDMVAAGAADSTARAVEMLGAALTGDAAPLGVRHPTPTEEP